MTDTATGTKQLVYTVPQVAKLLHVGEPRVYHLVASGGIPAIKLSDRATVIPCQALERYLVEEAFRQQAERRGQDESTTETLPAIRGTAAMRRFRVSPNGRGRPGGFVTG